MTRFAGLAVLDAAFVADGGEDFVNERHIEGCGHGDRHRKYRGDAVAGHAVQRLVPPVVGGNAERIDRLRGMHHQGRLFFEGQSGDQVGGALLGRRHCGLRALTGRQGRKDNG